MENRQEKNLTIDERNLTSTQWVEYNNGTKRTLYNSLPMSDITAEAVSVDAFALSQTDNAGITTTATRSYTANGMTLTQTDGRGNTTTTVTDKAGRTLTVTDAAGNVTTTVYGITKKEKEAEIKYSKHFKNSCDSEDDFLVFSKKAHDKCKSKCVEELVIIAHGEVEESDEGKLKYVTIALGEDEFMEADFEDARRISNLFRNIKFCKKMQNRIKILSYRKK